MRKHPEYGLKALETSPGLNSELLDIVIHHHEYLDGSGYPHGLRASEISDPVRIMTICDVFGALLERRAYGRRWPPTSLIRCCSTWGTSSIRTWCANSDFTKTMRFDTAA